MAVASHHKLPVISLSAADVYSPYVGDAEAEIRKAFRIARQASPCVLFIDELDALVTNRGISEGNSDVESRVLATFLTEMDGIDGKSNGVIVIGATNRLESIDAAMIRKGRFYQLLKVPSPSLEDQENILRYFAQKSSLSIEDINNLLPFLKAGISGAEIENLVKEETLKVMNQIIMFQ
jgi:SpoVK/Ycf46/Vps4 family AAA+-type ATPase